MPDQEAAFSKLHRDSTRQHALISHQYSRVPEEHSQQNRMQATVNVHCHHPDTPPPTVATQWTRLQLHAAYGLQCLTMHCQWG